MKKLSIEAALEQVDLMEIDNREVLSGQGVCVIPLSQVELSIALENGEKLVRYPTNNMASVTFAAANLRHEAEEKGVVGDVVLFAEWREDLDGEHIGDKVGEEYSCILVGG